MGVAGVAGNGQSELLEALAGIRPVKSGRIRWRGRDVTDAGRALAAPHAAPRPPPRAGGSAAHGPRHPVLGPGERHPRLPGRAQLPARAPAQPSGRGSQLPAPGVGVRCPASGGSLADLGVLGRQPAEDRAGPGARPGPGPAPRGPAHARRGHRGHRVHPPPAGGAPGRREGGPPGLGRAGRDPRARRPHPRHARRAHRGRGAAGRGHRACHRAHDGRASHEQ